MNLVKTKSGVFIPAYPSDHDAAKKIKEGEEVYATKARNPDFHRKVMSLFQLGFENQQEYDNFDIYRQSVTLKAGYVIYVRGKDNELHAFAESLSFASMSQDKFEKLFAAVLEVISKETKTSGKEIKENLASYF